MKRKSDMAVARKQLERENKKRSPVLVEIPHNEWPYDDDPKRVKVLVSQKYLVQVFEELSGVTRLSCTRTSLNQKGAFEDGLMWEDLMEIKRQAGYGEKYAVEVLPEDRNIVNVCNMRHIWVLPVFIIGWGTAPPEEEEIIDLVEFVP